MQVLKRHFRNTKGGILYIKVDDIVPSPVQPRKHFNRKGLEELSASIREHGVLQPLSVRARNGKYELIAGERRLRAAKMAGLDEVPCLLLDVNMEESSLIALVENLQRRDLDVIEEAEGIAQLIRMFGMSQEECARRLGKSQSGIANKLRLLRLPSDVLERIRDEELTERHGRALLRLQTSEEQRMALEHILEENLNVAAAESYIDFLLSARESILPQLPVLEEEPAKGSKKTGGQKTQFIIKDVRIFLNTLARGMSIMKQGGIDVGFQKEETDSDLILKISIPKNLR